MSQVQEDNPSPTSGQVNMDDLESDFNLKVVLVSFKQCLNEKEEDVVTKLQVMERLCSGPQRDHYSSLQSMVAYEVFLEAMNVGSTEQAVAMLGEALPFIEHVYDISQKLYAEHALLDLP
ncbi:Glycolipid transfer protein domain-containing protein 1 [Myotis brandtii]|uniref:Glycolipid transfer protein domain-containing protein 1 n=1 Tax=Myotis brandtii TaxID=109478 RepID=S7PQT0_MYOBR|nr:Glycolipid transfer protein domain-containing protein 1 [Myotis brandtii]